MKKFKGVFAILISTVIILLPSFMIYAKEDNHIENNNMININVSDFGAIVDDNKDDSKSIKDAINYAVVNAPAVIEFEKGVYDFFENPISGKDKEAYIFFENANDIMLKGSVDNTGNPNTVFMRHNTGEDNADLRQLLCVNNSKNITFKNITFDMDSPYYTACDVESVKGSKVTLKVSQGFPVPDINKWSHCHLPAIYDKTNKTFYDQRLVWTDEDGKNAPKFNVKDKSNPDIIEINNKEIAKKIKNAVKEKGIENILLFFWQGHYTECAKMIYFNGCENLTVENVNIYNGTGFVMTCDFCRNIIYKNVKAEPKEGMCAVAPRDCFKLYCCSGDIVLDSVTMDGFEDDGQNCHGMYSTVNKIIDENNFIANLTQVNKSNPNWLLNTEIRFLSPETNELAGKCIISNAEQIDDEHWKITTKEPLPTGIVTTENNEFKNTTVFELEAYLSKSWTIRNCNIRNTYRGLKISAQNVVCENNVFENDVYGIYMGAENDEWWHESQNPRHIIIRNNVFKKPLSGVAIDMDFHSYADSKKAPVIEDIQIYNNKFIDCDTAISIRDSKNVYVYDNTFENVINNTFIETDSTKDIFDVSVNEANKVISMDEMLRKQENKSKNIKITLIVALSISVLVIVVLGIVYFIKKKNV